MSVSKFRKNLHHSIFRFEVFWQWLLLAFVQGTAIYWLVHMSYSDSVDVHGRLVDKDVIGCLMFSVCMNVINVKLQLTLVKKSGIAAFISLLTTGLYYFILILMNDPRVMRLTGEYDLQWSVPEQMTTLRGICVQVLVTSLVLTPDFLEYSMRRKEQENDSVVEE